MLKTRERFYIHLKLSISLSSHPSRNTALEILPSKWQSTTALTLSSNSFAAMEQLSNASKFAVHFDVAVANPPRAVFTVQFVEWRGIRKKIAQ